MMTDWLKYNGIWIPRCPFCGSDELERFRINGDIWMKCKTCGLSFRFRLPKEIVGQPISIPSRSLIIPRQLIQATHAKIITRCRKCQVVLINHPGNRCPFCRYRIPTPEVIG